MLMDPDIDMPVGDADVEVLLMLAIIDIDMDEPIMVLAVGETDMDMAGVIEEAVSVLTDQLVFHLAETDSRIGAHGGDSGGRDRTPSARRARTRL